MTASSSSQPTPDAQERTATNAEPSASRTIYVVTGTTGEYSDRGEWLSAAFETEELAKSFVELLTTERQKLPNHDDWWDNRDAVEEAMRAFDPGYQEDYTGTRWFVQPVKLVEGR